MDTDCTASLEVQVSDIRYELAKERERMQAEIDELKDQIKHLRFDVKAQPEYKEIVKRAREKGSTAEIVAMIRSAEWRELAERYRDGLKELEKTAVACRWTYRSDERGRMLGVIDLALYGKELERP